jgi:hypothetical protein
MAPFHVFFNVSASNLQIGPFLGYVKLGHTPKGPNLVPWCLLNFVVSINLVLLSSDFINDSCVCYFVVHFLGSFSAF